MLWKLVFQPIPKIKDHEPGNYCLNWSNYTIKNIIFLGRNIEITPYVYR